MRSVHLRRIRDKDVGYILDLAGYTLFEHYVDKYGNVLPAIERFKGLIICRCIRKPETAEKRMHYRYLFATHKGTNERIKEFINFPDISVIFIEEFNISKIDFGKPSCSDRQLKNAFYFYMSKRYEKWNYAEDYYAYHKEQLRRKALLEEMAKNYVHKPSTNVGRPRGITIRNEKGEIVDKGMYVRASKRLHAPDYVPKKRKPRKKIITENSDSNM